MKILFIGGGSGGHFFPLIAVAERVNDLIEEEKILGAKLYYMAPEPYDKNALVENNIRYRYIPAGKMRIYFSIRNFFDMIKTFFGILGAVVKVFFLMPDVIFSKGGYASFPVLLAARLFRIPVVMHESDTVPGRVNIWASRFAVRAAVSFGEAAEYFPKEKVAVTGQPIRKSLMKVSTEGGHEYLNLDPTIPVVWVVGGSQGAQIINNAILDALPELLNSYQVVHQTGMKNFEEVSGEASIILEKHPYKARYKPLNFLNPLATRMVAGISDVVISRSGSMVFEIAQWEIPAIVIPYAISHGDHQKHNAYAFARSGAGVVIEEANLTPTVLLEETERILTDESVRLAMIDGARKFATPQAADVIAREIVDIALNH